MLDSLKDIGRRRLQRLLFKPLGREYVAALYLRGVGIEIGALHKPLPLPPGARARHVDRMSTGALRKLYREIEPDQIVDVEVVVDAHTLLGIDDRSQDFVVANHLVEHCEDPVGAILAMFRVLKPGGVLYLSVPDMRYTFDAVRPLTPFDHLLRDHQEGPEWSRRSHFEEWSRLVNKRPSEAMVVEEAQHLIDIGYTIHFHVWTQWEFLELLGHMRTEVACDLEILFSRGEEVIAVLRKGAEGEKGE